MDCDGRRQMPVEFPSAFIEHGHDRIHEETFRASWQTVKRWIDALPDDVREAREAFLHTRWPNGRPGPNRMRNYVLGNRLGRERGKDGR